LNQLIETPRLILRELSLDDLDAETGLGYLFHRPFWGQGYATEAAEACLNYAFAALGKSRVVAPIRPENAASLAVARKLGMEVQKRTMYAGFEHLIYVASTHQYVQF
jgi:RimJ/RimL family protein N-acetyltransferase